MNHTLELEMQESRSLWRRYTRVLDTELSVLQAPLRESVQRELEAHVRDSMGAQPEGSEAERLQSALERLGDPEQVVAEWIALAEETRATSRRWRLIRSLKQLGLGVGAGAAYLVAFYLLAISVLKLFFPAQVGLFRFDSGWWVLGFVDANGTREVLGVWLAPLALLTAFALWRVGIALMRRVV